MQKSINKVIMHIYELLWNRFFLKKLPDEETGWEKISSEKSKTEN